MLDLELFRKNPKAIEDEIKKRELKIDIDSDIKLDIQRRNLISRIDEMRAKKNDASKLISKVSGLEREKLIFEMKNLNEDLKNLEIELETVEKKFFLNLAGYPNITHPSVPVGKNENDNVILYKVGEKPDFDFTPANHIDLGTRLDIIDENSASKISGARFVFLKNDAVLLQFALIKYVFDILISRGYIPLIPPVLVKERA
ncbi:MAG: serine--tRNA ligase, partial [Actinobacteria bacterium]|nr:serine--tRNA ligase [Actinomycetota bacterium]